jgi:hypothetical protein
MRQWRASTGSETSVVRQNHAIASLARTPWALFDHSIARQVYPMAYEQASALLEERKDLRSLLTPRLRRAA